MKIHAVARVLKTSSKLHFFSGC